MLTLLNSGRAPTEAELQAHFSEVFLNTVPSSTLTLELAQIETEGPFHYAGLEGSSTDFQLVALLDGAAGASFRMAIDVAAVSPYLIEGLFIRVAAKKGATWRTVVQMLSKEAGHPSILAAEVRKGRLKTIRAFHPTRTGAIGSAFKLYVLGALATAIESGKARWQEKLAIREAWKSISTGVLQDAYYTQRMIASSDNTAADHLIRRLGRRAVEKASLRLGDHAARRNAPLLTTREAFVLKLDAPAGLVRAYVRAGSKTRRHLLKRVDAIPLSTAGVVWNKPRFIDRIEWFASPADLGRAMVGLQRLARKPKLAPIRAILSKNPGVPIDVKVWRYVAYKGGSEPGVLAFSWYLQRRDGRAFVLAIVLNDPRREIDLFPALSAAESALALLARS
jgi:hypothetical protein